MKLALVAVLAVAVLSLPSSRAAADPAPPDAQTYATERTLEAAAHPARDLYQLYPRLHGRDPSSIQRIVGTTKGWAVGMQQSFWVGDQVNKKYNRTSATLEYMSDYAYWFVQDKRPFSQTALVDAAKRFDDIVRVDHAAFGTEWSPGVDNDPRIVILVATTPGAGGYYSSADEYPSSINPYSNQHEMIYINSDPGDPYFDATLAHEFQHMIHWHEHANQDVWMNEGMSEYAMELNGYGDQVGEELYARRPDTQLNMWADSPDAARVHYSQAYRFMSYFGSRFGASFMHAIITAPGSDLDAVDEALHKLPSPTSLQQVYSDWLTSNYLVKQGGPFGYKLQLTPASLSELAVGSRQFGTVKQWGADYYRVRGDGPFTVTLSAQPTVKLVDNSPRGGQFEWWSNRGDLLDSTLTRSVDLSAVTRATLGVDMWYDIEQDFDYGYIEVSTDNGTTWTTLRGQHSTTTNPNGNNLGNGYTGKSGGWITDRFDLSPYAGKHILLRIEYVTDDGYNTQGLVIDGVRIPEIAFSDDSKTDQGWRASGWVRTNNTLPAHYDLQVIDPSGGGSYIRVPVGADGRAIATVDARSGESRVIVVGGQALETTVDSDYEIGLRQGVTASLAAMAGRVAPPASP